MPNPYVAAMNDVSRTTKVRKILLGGRFIYSTPTIFDIFTSPYMVKYKSMSEFVENDNFLFARSTYPVKGCKFSLDLIFQMII
jgi:hypothetical protein